MSGFSASGFDINNTTTTYISEGMDLEEDSEESLLNQLGTDELCSYVAMDTTQAAADESEDIFADNDIGVTKKSKRNKDSVRRDLAEQQSSAKETGSNTAPRTADEIAMNRKIKSIKQKSATHTISDDFNNATVVNDAIQKARIDGSSGLVSTASLRKTQKDMKKKAMKSTRRTGEVGGTYDFDADFEY